MSSVDTPMLGPFGVKVLKQRGISQQTAERLQIYTARADKSGACADLDGNVLAFPFIENGEVVAEKYRAAGKKFWQRPGGKRVFYNAEALDLATGSDDKELDRIHPPSPLIIVEGELDCAAVLEAGWQAVVSVPDGAPSALTSEGIEAEVTGKFKFLYHCRDKLRRIARFIIAVDNDEPGEILSRELVRRLSPSRCSFVTYPTDCKDMNDVLMKYGREQVMHLITGATPYPVRGLYKLSEYPDLPETEIFSTGWEAVDQHIQLFFGELMVVTGIPGHGKSSWVVNLAVNCGRVHNWRTAIFSPEMPVVPHMRDKLRAILNNGPPLDAGDRNRADDWIEDYFCFLDSDPGGAWEDDQDKTIEWLIERASEAVMRDGVRLLIIDPWNEVEHSRSKGETESSYIGRSLRDLRRMAREHQLAVIVVAHPTKDIADKVGPPGLYDIDGSAHWANKPDHGVTIYRPGDGLGTRSEVHVHKVRFPTTGQRGKIHMLFDTRSQSYGALDAAAIAEIEAEQVARNAAKQAKKNKRGKKGNVVEIRPGVLKDDEDKPGEQT